MFNHLQPSGDGTRPKKREAVVGCQSIEGIPMNTRTLEPSRPAPAYFAHPGFYMPLPPLNPATAVFTKNTPNMGVGLFAKCSVSVNQVVFSERPLLIFPSVLTLHNTRGLSKEEKLKAHYAAFEEILQQALNKMTKEDANAYTSLANCLPECPPLYGISRTNSFSTGSDIEAENLEEGKFGYATVGRLASRINHCCMPNVTVDFDTPAFSLKVIASRAIKAGEQLFYCYCQPDRSVKERRRQLANYGFVCQCKACVNATPESDKLREEMDNIIRKIIDEEEEMLANPRFSIRSIDPLLKLERDIVKDGLDFGQMFANLLCIILHAYRKAGNTGEEMKYYNKWKNCTGKVN